MRTAPDLLADYARYHRDRRNVVTHCIGVPMIVFAVAMLLSRPQVDVGGVALTPGWLLAAIVAVWAVTRHGGLLGWATAALMAVAAWNGHQAAALSTSVWLGLGFGLFVVGWAIQFVGHHFEGRKPAFVDDLAGLLIGPMFVIAEALFACGWNRELQRDVERRAAQPPDTARA